MGISVFPEPTISSSATQKWTQIGAYTSTTQVSTIDFTSISQSYRALRLIVNGLVKQTDGQIYIRFNSNSGNNYAWNGVWGEGGSYIVPTRIVDQTTFYFPPNGAGIKSTGYFNLCMDIYNYAEVNAAKNITWKATGNDTNNFVYYEDMIANWNTGASTPAITSINFLTSTGNLNVIGSNSNGIFLYGGN